MTTNNEYLHLDEFKDTIASLKMLVIALRELENDPSFWKQAILSTHSALQGACVCILTRTDGGGALAERSEKALMIKLYGESEHGRNIDDDSVHRPKEFIASLPELLSRLPGGLVVNITKRSATCYPYNKEGDLRRLHEFRNKLTHFPPVSWSLEVAGLPRILLTAIGLIDEISRSNSWKTYNQFPNLHLDNDIEQARKLLKKFN